MGCILFFVDTVGFMDTSFHGYQNTSEIVGSTSECIVIFNQLERSYCRMEGECGCEWVSEARVFVHMCMGVMRACTTMHACLVFSLSLFTSILE